LKGNYLPTLPKILKKSVFSFIGNIGIGANKEKNADIYEN
jgi:hypothetical protein